jgi:hypothetical protein
MAHLDVEGRVFWSSTPISDAELNSLTRAATCTVALYRDSGPNTRDMGMASGKIMRSLINGTPVIASHFRGLEFIEAHGLGILVSRPHEIPEAVRTIFAEYDEMHRNCLVFRDSHLNFRKYWHDLWAVLEPGRLPESQVNHEAYES